MTCNVDRQLMQLANRACDDRLTGDEAATLQQLISDSPEQALRYLGFCELHARLAAVVESHSACDAARCEEETYASGRPQGSCSGDGPLAGRQPRAAKAPCVGRGRILMDLFLFTLKLGA